VKDQEDQPNSLLRRLLGQDQAPRTPPDAPNAEPSPASDAPLRPPHAADSTLPRSPVRPSAPADDDPQPLLAPLPLDKTPSDTGPLTPREQLQRSEEALIALRERMAQVAAAFAQGELNQAQFDAIYARYSEQRDITERLLTRNPESQTWQSVIRPGATRFLLEHFAAVPLSYAIYDQDSFDLITVTGKVLLADSQVRTALRHLSVVRAERGNPGPAQRSLEDGRCVVFVPGDLTAAVVIFSLAPARAQIERVRDIHRDFERANGRALQRRDTAAGRLVFPHRALFER